MWLIAVGSDKAGESPSALVFLKHQSLDTYTKPCLTAWFGEGGTGWLWIFTKRDQQSWTTSVHLQREQSCSGKIFKCLKKSNFYMYIGMLMGVDLKHYAINHWPFHKQMSLWSSTVAGVVTCQTSDPGWKFSMCNHMAHLIKWDSEMTIPGKSGLERSDEGCILWEDRCQSAWWTENSSGNQLSVLGRPWWEPRTCNMAAKHVPEKNKSLQACVSLCC